MIEGKINVTRHRGEYIDIQGTGNLESVVGQVLVVGFESLMNKIVDPHPEEDVDVESFMARFRKVAEEHDFSRFELEINVAVNPDVFEDVDVSVTDVRGNMNDTMLAYAMAILLTDMTRIKVVVGERLYS